MAHRNKGVDITIGTAGNTTAGTTSASPSIVFNNDKEVQLLKAKINALITSMNGREDYIKNLEFQLRLARASNKKEEVIQDMTGFTKEELKFILSKVHPDKNPNSKIATALTTKLLKNR